MQKDALVRAGQLAHPKDDPCVKGSSCLRLQARSWQAVVTADMEQNIGACQWAIVRTARDRRKSKETRPHHNSAAAPEEIRNLCLRLTHRQPALPRRQVSSTGSVSSTRISTTAASRTTQSLKHSLWIIVSPVLSPLSTVLPGSMLSRQKRNICLFYDECHHRDAAIIFVGADNV